MSRRKRNPKLVHFTHHSCLANGIGIEGLHERLYEPDGQYPRSKHETTYGSHARHLAAFGHLHCRYGSRSSLLTTDLDAVTCTTCLAGVAGESRERLFEKASRRGIGDVDRRFYEKCAEAWCDDDELRMRAWLICCRHVGAPCPVSRRQAIRRLRAERARLAYRDVRSAVVGHTFYAALKSTKGLAKVLEKMDPSDRKLMRDALSRAKRADALLDKVVEINKSIESIAKHAAKHIASHAVIELPASAS